MEDVTACTGEAQAGGYVCEIRQECARHDSWVEIYMVSMADERQIVMGSPQLEPCPYMVRKHDPDQVF